jgi:hypothetical protein
MQQSPSCKATPSSASLEIPRVTRNPKVRHHVQNNLPFVPILSQINPVHALP